MNQGVAGYAQFKVTGHSGADIPRPLRGFKNRVLALGPESNVIHSQAAANVGRALRARIWRALTTDYTLSFSANRNAKHL